MVCAEILAKFRSFVPLRPISERFDIFGVAEILQCALNESLRLTAFLFGVMVRMRTVTRAGVPTASHDMQNGCTSPSASSGAGTFCLRENSNRASDTIIQQE